MIIYTPIPKFNITMITSPKCGCQTMDKITHRIFKHPFFLTYQCGVPSKSKDNLLKQRSLLDSLLQQISGHTIIASRHPVKRLLSCYNYMILGQHHYPLYGGGKTWFKEPLEKVVGKPLRQITLTEFIDYILQTPDNLRDIHFSTQSFLVEDINFDKIIKIENFSQGLKDAASLYNLPLVVPQHIQKNKTNYNLVKLNEITSENLDKIHHIYKSDFNKFDHSKLSAKETIKYIKSKSLHGPVHQGPNAHKSRRWEKLQ